MTPNVDEIYGDSRSLLTTKDVQEGKTLRVTIKSVKPDKIGQSDKIKLVLELDNGKSFALNKTNAQRLSEQFGANYETWVGKSFDIIRSFTMYQGSEVACLRVARKLE